VQPDGVVYHYQRDYGDGWDITYSNEGNVQHREYHLLEFPGCCGGEYYAISDTEAAFSNYIIFCAGGIDPTYGYCEPPLPVAKANMQDGDSWIWTGHTGGGEAMIYATVAAQTITLTFGTFEVLRVQFIPIYGATSLPYYGVYLQRDYGPVRQGDITLIGWDGPVRTEQQTWSNVKATFR
jgi:hypothetical protein